MADSPSIRTLARLAGVSNATISLALRHHPRIRPEVRERIQRIAEEAGYKSNPVVANLLAQLRSSKSVTFQSTLGLIHTGADHRLLEIVPTFREWVLGCEDRAASLGYALDRMYVGSPDVSPKRLVQILDARGIRGLLVIGPFDGNVIPPALDPIWERSAAIVIGVHPMRPALAYVASDQFTTAGQALRELVRRGYERPGLCLDSQVDDWVENRFSGGFAAAQVRLPAKNRIPPFDFKHDAKQRFTRWVERYRPDAIVSAHTEIEPWLLEMGVRLPDGMGLVHLDKSEQVPWAGMDQNNRQIGRAAVDMVIGQLHRNEFGVPPFQKCMFISSSWVSGPSIRRNSGSKFAPRKSQPYPPGRSLSKVKAGKS